MTDLILRNARVSTDSGFNLVDIGIKAGAISEIGKVVADTRDVEDLDGRLVIPGFVETHVHLDKSCVLDRCETENGRFEEAIQAMSQAKRDFTIADVAERARATLEKSILQGTTHMRTHLELDPAIGMRSFDAIMPLVEDYSWAIDLEVCVFPQEGIFNNPGTDELLVEALERGASLIGGCPYMDSEPKRHLERIFELASLYNVDIDLHLDFDTNPDGMMIGDVCDLTISNEMQGRVAVGHVTKLSVLPLEELRSIGKRLHDAGVGVTVLPSTDLFLMGRDRAFNRIRGVTPAHVLVEEGVTCSLSTNNVLNPFTPFGDCSLIRMANLYANIQQLGEDPDIKRCFEMITREPARMLRLVDYGLEVGCVADLLVLDNSSPESAVRELSPALFGFKRGRKTFTRRPPVLHAPNGS